MRWANPLSGAFGSVGAEPNASDSGRPAGGTGSALGSPAASAGCGLDLGAVGRSCVGNPAAWAGAGLASGAAVNPPVGSVSDDTPLNGGPSTGSLTAGGGSDAARATTGSSTVNGGGRTPVRSLCSGTAASRR
ncbi:MAG TPA: hypothetical protein VG411_09455, partial [Actinomycetota bacterium]|nr:hypothetical protein [Actinomycetota bacterium]